MTRNSRPNILILLADDLGWGDVSYHGAPIQTPNVDRLVDHGVELDRHYVCPMCTPTRCCLLTGRYPGRFGRHATVPSNAPVLPDGYATLATILRDHGYSTGIFGKWHLGSDPAWGPNQYGFGMAYGSLAGGIDPYSHRYKRGPHSITWHRNGELVEERGHATDLICAAAVQWIEAQRQPWFCYVPFTAVHTPVKAPQHWLDRYAGRRFDADPARDRSFKMYAAYASHMDWALGQLLEALERLCVRDDTLVLFFSDNGAIPADALHDTDKYPGRHEEMPRLGSNLPLRGQKAQLYEGGIRTPAVVSWPGVLTPARLGTPLHAVDWMPTLCALTQARPEQEPHWDGVDIWPLLSGREVLSGRQDRQDRAPLYWNFRGNSFGARADGWKLIADERLDAAHAELYDLERDPYETQDLAARHPERVHEMLEMIATARRQDDVARRPDAP